MSRSYRHGKYSRQSKDERLWHWLWAEPKWWRKMTKHKKRRAKWRMLKSQLESGRIDADDTAYPLDSRPWIYYW